MILSEEEAKKRWCPQARELDWHKDAGNIDRKISGYNRNKNGNIPACIASYCMVWRWAEAKKLRDIDLVTSDVQDLPPRTGYCGIAGKPEYD